MPGDADLVFAGGRIFTADPRRPWARAFAVRGDRLVAVGTDAQAARWSGKRTRHMDLRGRAVLPGFIDAHAHMAEEAGGRDWVDLAGSRSLAEALDRLRAAARKRPAGGWVVGVNWDEAKWPERRYLVRGDLDGVSTAHRVVAVRIDWHIASLGSRALEDARDLASHRGFEVDGAGRPTGVLKEDAFRAFYPRFEPSEDAILAGLGRMARRAHRLGITSIHDVVEVRGWRAYQRARRAGALRLRVYAMLRDVLLGPAADAGLSTGLGDEWLRLGAIKVFADGSLGAYTAALSRAYEGRPGDFGILVHGREELRAILERAHRAGFQAATHALGDAAIDLVVETFEGIQQDHPRRDARHRIEHFELPDDHVLARAKAAGLVASCQPNFVGQWSGPGDVYETRLGRERASRNNPYRRIMRRRIPLCFGSDGMPYGPLYGVHSAVNGFFPDQRISVEDSIRAYTLGGAYASFEEDTKGSLTAGKLADFVVLGRDPFEDPGHIRRVRVSETWIGGERVHAIAAKD